MYNDFFKPLRKSPLDMDIVEYMYLNRIQNLFIERGAGGRNYFKMMWNKRCLERERKRKTTNINTCLEEK